MSDENFSSLVKKRPLKAEFYNSFDKNNGFSDTQIFSSFDVIVRTVKRMDEMLQKFGGPWLLGEDYSLADIEVNQGLKLLTKEQKNMDSEELADIAFSLNNLKRKQHISELLNSVNKQKDIQAKIKLNHVSAKDHILSDSYTFRAQKALIEAKALYEKEEYQQANESLTEALNLFPNHEGIKLNLVQVLLKSYEHDRFMIKELKEAKRIILELITIGKDNESYFRLKKTAIM